MSILACGDAVRGQLLLVLPSRRSRWRVHALEIARPNGRITEVPYCMALRPGSPLCEQINAPLLEMLTDGTHDRIQETFGHHGSRPRGLG